MPDLYLFNPSPLRQSTRDWGVDKDARKHFNLSTPGKYFDVNQPQPPAFSNPDQGGTH